MQVIDYELEVSIQPSGRVLSGQVRFERPVRSLLYAWKGDQLVWMRAPFWDAEVEVNLCYHPCTDDRIQLVAGISKATMTDLMLVESDLPTTSVKGQLELCKPSNLFKQGDHGVGILAVPKEMTQSKRKGLWLIQSNVIPNDLAFFDIPSGRSGKLSGHPFG